MKIQYIYIVLLSAILGFTSSCSDSFLDKQSPSEISSAIYWETESDALMALAACYDGFQRNMLYNGDPWTTGAFAMDCMTDNGGRFNWSGWMPGYDIANGIHTPNSWFLSDYWSQHYEIIIRCNMLLDNVDKVDMDDKLIATYKAEAIVLRALAYNNLISTYNDVPYITKVQSIKEANWPKSPRAEIAKDLIADLKAHVGDLKETADRGRITKGAAWSVLGRIALYNELWEEAANSYSQVVGLGIYGLHPNYASLFSESGKTSNEVIFAVRYEGPGKGEGSSFNTHWNAPLEAMNATLDLANAFYCTDGLPPAKSAVYVEGKNDLQNNRPDVLRYENRDERLNATLFTPGMKWGNNSAEFYGGSAPSVSTLYVYKYFNPANENNSGDGGQDFYIFRYGEVLLSYAEALVQKGGYNYEVVTGLVDEVRQRAGMPIVKDVEGANNKTLSSDELLSVIKHERRVETAFEGLRLFDLYRWKELDKSVKNIEAERATASPENGTHFYYEKRTFRGEKEYIWPLPQKEIDSNKLLEQHNLWK